MVESLKHTAAAAIAKLIHNGHFNSKSYAFDQESSNEVYAQLLRLDPQWSYNIDLKLKGLSFILTKVNFENVEMGPQTFGLLTQHNLKSLVLGNQDEIPSLEHYMSRLFRTSQIDHLDLSGRSQFSTAWLKTTGQQLPLLRTLNVSGVKLLNPDFFQFCKSFPNLYSLDISNCGVTILTGISRLKNLRHLSLRSLIYESWYDIRELFALKLLNVLDLSMHSTHHARRNMQRFLDCKQVLPELRFLECSGNLMDEDMLEELLITHSHLHQLAIVDCDVKAPKSSPIRILSCTTFDSSITALKYYLNLKRRNEVQICFQELRLHVKRLHERKMQYDVTECVTLSLQSLEKLPCSLIMNFDIVEERLFTSRLSFEADFLAEIVLHNFHRLSRVHTRLICDILLNNVNRQLIRDLRAETMWNAIIYLFNMGVFVDKQKLKGIASHCAASLHNGDPIIEEQAMRILTSCVTGKTLELVLSITESKHDTTPICLGFLRAALHKEDEQSSRRVAEKILAATHNNEEECKRYIKHGAMNMLISAIDRFDSEPMHIVILGIIRNLVMMSPYDKVQQIFTCVQFRTFQILLRNWTSSDRAYLMLSIFALRLNHQDKNFECVFRKCADELLRKHFPYLLATEITVDVDIYFDRGIVQNILRTSEEVGLVLWALLTIKIYAQKSLWNSRSIRDSNFFYLIENPHIASEVVNVASENVRFLFHW